MFIVIGGLLLLVTHAANKVATLDAQKKASNGSDVPPNTAIAATGASGTPSPATALGAPGAASAVQVKYSTNSPYALPAPSYYRTGAEQAGLNGVPLPFVPGKNFNGFNAVPARTKQLLTAGQIGSSSPGGPGAVGGQKL